MHPCTHMVHKSHDLILKLKINTALSLYCNKILLLTYPTNKYIKEIIQWVTMFLITVNQPIQTEACPVHKLINNILFFLSFCLLPFPFLSFSFLFLLLFLQFILSKLLFPVTICSIPFLFRLGRFPVFWFLWKVITLFFYYYSVFYKYNHRCPFSSFSWKLLQ